MFIMVAILFPSAQRPERRATVFTVIFWRNFIFLFCYRRNYDGNIMFFFLVRNYIRNFNSRVPKKDWISFWIYAFKYIFPLKFISACSPLLLLSTKKQNYRNAKKISIARREECPLNSMTIHKYLMIFFPDRIDGQLSALNIHTQRIVDSGHS